MKEILKKAAKELLSKIYFRSKEGNISYYETPVGNYYLPNDNPRDQVISQMKCGRFFEKDIIDIAREYIKPETAVLDIGSNFGQMSIEFSKAVGERGKVYAFEADDFIFSLLEKNIKANGRNNIQLIFGAVYNEIDTEKYYPKQDFNRFWGYGSYGIDPNATSGRKVKTLTIDSLEISEPISFMKVDIQGSDFFAMLGARNTILKNKMPIIFEFEQELQAEFRTTFQDYLDFCHGINYEIARIIRHNYLIVPKS